MFLISAFRLNLGNDYQMYLEGFIKMGIDGFSTVRYLDWEIGFNIFTKVVAFFTRDERIYFAISALICLIPPAWFILKNSSNVFISTLIYINLSFFYCTMNFLRQGIAIAIMLLSWQFLVKRKFVPFLLVILLASTFHVAVLIILPMYFLVNMKIEIKTILLYCYGWLCFFISSDGFIKLITELFYPEYQNSVFINEGLSIVHCIIPLLLVVAVLLLARQSDITRVNRYLANMLLIATFFMIAMSKHAIFERLSYYPYIFVLLLIPNLFELVKQWFDKRIYVITIISAMLIFFIYNIYSLSINVHGVTPYQSWLGG